MIGSPLPALPDVTDFFSRRWSIFCATTYSFEPELFEGYLLRRLGAPPLNVVVLADAGRLGRLFRDVPSDEQWRFARANRDYLLRGVYVGGGSFHPKSYLFANEDEGTLLVGSGNLGRHGLDRGREVFTQYSSTDLHGLTAIGTWRDWVLELIDGQADELLSDRFRDLLLRAPWLVDVAPGENLLHNLDEGILVQLERIVARPVEELHVMAPFFDREAAALAELVQRLAPRCLNLYVGEGTSVAGEALVGALENAESTVAVHAFEPADFVHAKLIAAVSGETATLVGGSANLSRAALLGATARDAWSNVELATVTSCSAESARSLFTPPGTRLTPLEIERLGRLKFEQPVELGIPLLLSAARFLEDGRVRLLFHRPPPPDLRLTAGLEAVDLVDGVTVSPLPVWEHTRLVWLVDSDGREASNRVPVDEPRALSRALEQRERVEDRPRELTGDDLETPLGQLIQILNEGYLFDPDDAQVMSRLERAAQERGEEEPEQGDFWERLAREELQRDARARAYRRFAEGAFRDDVAEFEALRRLLAQLPAPEGSPSGSPRECGEGPATDGKGRPWTLDQKARVRFGNVLDRYARALADPRLLWLAPLAPVRNFGALTKVVAECWERELLPRGRLTQLLEQMFTAFIAGGDSYLASVDEEERHRAICALEPGIASLASALAYLALRRRDEPRPSVFAWQPFLVPGLDCGVFAFADADVFATLVGGVEVPGGAVEHSLRESAVYIDDSHWCVAMEAELGLDDVELVYDSTFAAKYKVKLRVRGVPSLLEDRRIVPLIRHALEYRRAEGAVVGRVEDSEGGHPQRLSVLANGHMYAAVDGHTIASREPVSIKSLEQLENEGVGFSGLDTSAI